ncbi:hypothetical protein O6H91_07G015000 [Diphasiastrum complanatum]|uniref:Uncharacterized protein n=1 Tax=Diphasiastrum complanatum TaxID=34168 RepID=A0ACC2D2R4_DIPCM|nr:hypothetical protein O6H91_07G015000 [Diphasiastrum complanatum]
MESPIQPPSKRARTSPFDFVTRGVDDYLPGNIIEVEVHNFMTYAHIKSQPAPRLNLVIGPNGTGKSSLVCAIGLGLAGEPQLLGRAGSIGDYVRRGEESGWIKISLRGNLPSETVTITRRINKQNRSEWLLNGRTVPKREIQEVVQQFNIQVTNLTQVIQSLVGVGIQQWAYSYNLSSPIFVTLFLPQDRVCEFAKMSPIQLLEETEKAVGDPELATHHETLIKRMEDLKKLQMTIKQHEVSLNQLRANNSELERDVERVQLRNKLFEKADAFKKKLPWLKYDRHKFIYKEAKEREKEAKRKLHAIAEQILELKAPLEEAKKNKEKSEAACKKLLTVNTHNEKKHREIADSENEMSVQVRAKMNEIEDVRKREASRQDKIEKAKQDLADAEAELANLPNFEPPREEIEQIGAQIHELEIAASDKRRQVHEMGSMQVQKRGQIDHCMRRIQEIENVNNRRLQALKNSGAHNIFEAFQWVESHRQEFKKDVFGPVLLEVNIQSREHASFVEGHVPFYIWKSFITQDPEDRDLLVRNLKPFEVPVINYTGEKETTRTLAISREMEELGITGKLDQVISAPKIVKEVLTTQFGLDQSFIGTLETNLRADEACRLGIRDLWTPENHFRWQASRYGGHISASVNPVRNSRLFSENIDTREQNELEHRKAEAEDMLARLEEEIKGLRSEQRHVEDKAAELHKQREEIINRGRLERKRRQDMVNRIEQRRRKLESFDKEEDLHSALCRLQNQISKLNEERLKRVIRMKELLMEAADAQVNHAALQLSVVESDINVRNKEREFRSHELLGTRAQQEYDQCKLELAKCRADLEAAKSAAEQVAKITPDLQRSFAEMPDTIEDLCDAIEDCIAQAGAVLCPNPNVLEEYERRCQQITSLEAKYEHENAMLTTCLTEIESTKTTWLSTLRDLVGQINETFSRNFREMAVAGEVSLDEHDMDFDKYGILIKVKFRETGELQVLSAHHQSGGERSVSTILYLVSLQNLTNCPFRVVDEINQGMDPINERKMFQQLVRAASQPNTPQCFLLTPKLLPELDYSECCSILSIMNGPWIEKPSKVWSNGMSWSAVSQSLSQPVS